MNISNTYLYEHNGVVTQCHHPSYCGTLERKGILWDVYTLGFVSVVTNGKVCKALDEYKLSKLVDKSKILCWVN